MHSLPGVTSKGDLQLAELRQARGQEPARPQSESAEASFGDVLDIVNPLQHIPGVASVYRDVTGDEISGHAKVLGSTLYGGPLGMLAGSLSAAMTEESGKSFTETAVAGFTGGSGSSDGGAMRTAAATQATGQTAEGTASATGATTDTGETRTNGAARAATAALPAGIDSVLPPAPATGGNGNAEAASGRAGAQATNGGNVLQGEQALAAFARDKAAAQNGGTNTPASGSTGSASEAARTPQGSAERRASAGDRAASLNQQQGFMTLRDSDYATSAEMRARMQHLDEYQAQAANEVSPRVDSNSSATHADEPAAQSAQRGIQPSGAPDDFASRMKEALSKYRAMHNNE